MLQRSNYIDTKKKRKCLMRSSIVIVFFLFLFLMFEKVEDIYLYTDAIWFVLNLCVTSLLLVILRRQISQLAVR